MEVFQNPPKTLLLMIVLMGSSISMFLKNSFCIELTEIAGKE